jgi:ribose transport system substrate-binding protein
LATLDRNQKDGLEETMADLIPARPCGRRIVAIVGALGCALLLPPVVHAQDIVAEAKADIAQLAAQHTPWSGPSSAPKPDPGKLVVWLSVDEQNQASHQWGQAIKDAATHVGWRTIVIDGRDTPSGWLDGLNQAIAQHADGVITDVDITSLKGPIAIAQQKGMALVGIHGAARPGPQPDIGLFFNIGQDPAAIGRAQADWVIAHSDGHAHVVVTTHGEFAVAFTKAKATEDRLKQCKTCVVEEFSNSPMSEVAQRQPTLVAAWVQRYPKPLYITAVADYTLQFEVPALLAGHVDPASVILVGADGDKSAYARIRAGNQYQQVTVAEPYELEGFQAVDELNRAFHHLPPSGMEIQPYLVTAENIHAQGGDQDTYIPDNNYKEHYLQLWGVQK